MLRNKLQKYKLILASGSPRRQQFFKDLDLDFEIRLKEIEEIYPPELKAEEITNYLAELKAKAFEGELKENEILITSDTIVWFNDKALGKPKDAQDAFAILKSLSNATPASSPLLRGIFEPWLRAGAPPIKIFTTGGLPIAICAISSACG